jgi:penicillin-binding protein 1C
MRDNWAVGYSQRYTVGVWVGNASGAPMWDVSGTTGAAPIWATIMKFLHAKQPSRAPKPPVGVEQKMVQFANTPSAPSLEAARSEWFVSGTQQSTFAMDSGAVHAISTSTGDRNGLKIGAVSSARITAPTNGTIIALDPDIPPQAQRLTLQAEGNNLRWLVDGKQFAKGNAATWPLWPGRHLLQIADAKGQVLDQVRFEVRGAGVKPANGATPTRR